MIIEDSTFYLWEVKCNECGEVKIFYKEDVPTMEDLYGELLARNWVITYGGETYCLKCAEKVDG